MTTPPDSPELTPLERRAKALDRLDAGRQALRESLAGLDPDEAFLGSRWSVWEVLKHLDAESFVDALERIAVGEQEMLPPFTSREERLRQDIEHLEATYHRLRTVLAGLSEAQLSQPVTPPNPNNSFPGLTLLELVERVSGHAGAHAMQVELTRKYVAAFSAKERAVTVLGLGSGDPDAVPTRVRELIAFADYTAGDAAALELIRPWIRGTEISLRPNNREEVVARLGREARAGIWSVICCLGDDPAASDPELLTLAHHHCDHVAIVA